MPTTSVVADRPKVAKKSITVDAIHFFYKDGGEKASGDDMDVMVRVSASDKVTSRVPIDLVAVLDVIDNSSMKKQGAAAGSGCTPPPADKPCRLDLLKRAMEFIVEQLDDGDSIAVVALNSGNNIVADECTSELLKISDDSRTRASAKENIDKLQAKKGRTAFKPGLEQAVKILDGRSDKNRPGFILLLSDGDDKSQVQWGDKKASPSSSSDAARALLKQYPVHTFGLGAAHNAKPLFFIAQESGGTYSFVRDSHLGDVSEALAVCLGGLKSIVAIDTHIQVTPATEAVEIKGVGHHGVGFRWNLLEPAKAGVNFEVGTLYAGEVKSFHVKICRNKQCKKAKQKLLISAGGRYRDATSNSKAAAGASATVCIDSVYELQQHMPSSTSRVAEMLVLEKLNVFRDGLTDGLKKIAAKDKEAEKDSAKQELLRSWKEMMPNDRQLNTRVKACMDKLHNDIITAMANDLDGDKHGAAYLFSWLSSYNMQRATTMGSPDKVVAAFLTQAMKDEQEAAREKKRTDEAAAAQAQAQAHSQVVANTTMDSPEDKGVSAPAVRSSAEQKKKKKSNKQRVDEEASAHNVHEVQRQVVASSTTMDSPDKGVSAPAVRSSAEQMHKKSSSKQRVDEEASASMMTMDSPDKGAPAVKKSERNQKESEQRVDEAATRVQQVQGEVKSTIMDSPNGKAASAVKPVRKKNESKQCVDEQAAASVQQIANATTPVVVAKSEPPPPQQQEGQDEAAARVCMCRRYLDLDPINKQLEFWGKKKHDVLVQSQLVVSPESAAAGDSADVYFITVATSRFPEEPLEHINRQMYQDIFNLVAQQARDKILYKCNCETR